MLALTIASISTVKVYAQNSNNAISILDKTAKKMAHKGGISATFTMEHPVSGKITGSIAVKGDKFNASTNQAIVWFNGKTQWTYVKKNDEVNISTPTQAQQQLMNPYTFINIYKTGYNITSSSAGNDYEVHLVAQNKKRSIQELYITINKTTYIPSRIKMKNGGRWYNISVSSFSNKNLPDNRFVFNSKDYPSAEVIDLR